MAELLLLTEQVEPTSGYEQLQNPLEKSQHLRKRVLNLKAYIAHIEKVSSAHFSYITMYYADKKTQNLVFFHS